LTTGPGELHKPKRKEVNVMRLSAPKVVTFWIAVILVVLGVIAWFFPIVAVLGNILLLVGFALLALGNVLKML
jgi:hypothetical protein